MLRYVQAICVFTVTAAGLMAQTSAPNMPVTDTRTSGAVGIAAGQTARFNVLRPDAAATTACTAVLTYRDAEGATLKTSTVTVAGGTVGFLDLFSDADLSLAPGTRKQIRVTLTVPVASPSTSSAADAVKAKPVCRLIPTLEIFDEITGKVSVVLGGFHRAVSENAVTPTSAVN